jgi:methyltransferase (TIGR00027 family)
MTVTKAATLGAVAQTARWTAAARARETARPDRLFSDPFAEALAGRHGRALLEHFHTSHASPEGNPFLPVRTRWFDDFVADAVGAPEGEQAPTGQVVLLGAGLDTRAYRLDWPDGTVLYEVDQPDLLQYKADRLAPSAALPRCDLRGVPVDLARDWPGALRDAGFEPGRRTVWVVEGVLFYLPEGLARDVLQRTARLSGPGSRVAADLVGTGVFRFPYTQLFLQRLRAAGSPWLSGTDDPKGFVESTGWRVRQVVQPGQPGAAYGRWPAAATPDRLSILPRSYLVSAELPG